ncbi:tRNA (uracil-5-)-methyltransferase homolog A-like [Mercenaria mercenaria]|uniref:tRNA (uracil-5-)-methyltransferase homolog A-like n=1 Tax=Mercenaria mercenaria TaxID=6596 RepID=UPI00234F71F1|nr:tRNA (uracil-5-)-methyltransferase homolog A-like [Mercenaria mercenaria]XP_045171291.2 tRNA (uracil-5-)-methyltransferase homolog A-like [Mercenaria mercenaria]XP_053375251.1 tRNA (uracil-5-)-methyltransferase homolog A-like [Mercenaria mercenaria]
MSTDLEIKDVEIEATEDADVSGNSANKVPENKDLMEVQDNAETSVLTAQGEGGDADTADKLTKQGEPDEYLYTKRDEFTSEIYKIQISNLPKRFGFAELKKKFLQLDLKPVKMKVWKEICFVTFRCEQDREEALKKVNGLKWRSQELTATVAKPAADPLMRKRKQEEAGKVWEKKAKHSDDGLTPSEKLKNSVTPLWKLEYKDQLRKKEEEMRQFFKRLHRQLEKNCPDLKYWLLKNKKKYGAIPCELQPIIPSPVTTGYRNKCEFTIGPGQDGEDCVGFRYSTYAKGSVIVGSPEEISFLPDMMKTVVKGFQKYVLSSVYTAFNPENHTGNWRQLTVRTSRLGHVMVLIDFHPQNLTQEDTEKEMENIKAYFTKGDGQDCGITSCFFRSHTEKMTGAASGSPYRLVFGDENITESLLEMKFQISPSAFFQVNTAAAEVLYKTVSDWCNASPDTTVLDVCCGTGTIGLTVAKQVSRVVGIEMCIEAVEDAKVNAKLNGITNVTYHCAKAEDVMKDITRSVTSSSDVIAIVDPPRGGLHSSVVVAIRNCRSISRLVYVSCNVNGALNNIIDLVRPVSKRLRGPRFYPARAVPVDLFPHTDHCELVMLFEREQTDSQEDIDSQDKNLEKTDIKKEIDSQDKNLEKIDIKKEIDSQDKNLEKTDIKKEIDSQDKKLEKTDIKNEIDSQDKKLEKTDIKKK